MKRALMLLALALAVFPASRVQAQEFQIVVNASVGIDAISKKDLSKVFQKKASKIGGVKAAPVDLDKGSDVRKAFSKAVHGRSVNAIESYWQQQIFAGKNVPPDQKAGDADVLDYVRSTPGAVGYVSAGAAVGDGVKVITISG